MPSPRQPLNSRDHHVDVSQRVGGCEAGPLSTMPGQGRVTASSGKPIKLLSLGGCTTHEIAVRAANVQIHHDGHLWRRPTIPLMAPSGYRLEPMGDAFPAEFRKYWQDDFRKYHLDEIVNSDANVLAFDVTRDIFGASIRLPNGSFVLDPLSLGNIMGPLDGLTREDVTAVIGRDYTSLWYFDDEFLSIWSQSFRSFMEAVSERFDLVILNKIYFTNRLAGSHHPTFCPQSDMDGPNFVLDQLYDEAARYRNVVVNKINNRYFLTGQDVSWGGPNLTHFVDETLCLFAENLRGMLLGSSYVSGEIFIKNAFQKSAKYEDELRKTADMTAQIGQSEAQRAEAFAERDETMGQLSAERKARAARLRDLHQARRDVEAQAEQLALLTDLQGQAQAQAEEAVRDRDAQIALVAKAERERDAEMARRHESERLNADLRAQLDQVLRDVEAQAEQLALLTDLQGQAEARAEEAVRDRDAQSAALAEARDARAKLEADVATLTEQARASAAERDEAKRARADAQALLDQRSDETDREMRRLNDEIAMLGSKLGAKDNTIGFPAVRGLMRRA